MRVLHLDLGLSLRGGQRQVMYLAGYLKDRPGLATTVACPAASALLREARRAGIDTLPLPGRREWDPRNWLALAIYLRDRGVDILHTHDARAASLGSLLKLVLGDRLKLVHTRRVSYPLGSGWSRQKYLLADSVAGVSREIAAMVASAGVPGNRVLAIHSGIDTASYPAKTDKGKDAPLIIGSVGALTPQKGYPILLAALAVLKGATGLPAWRAWIIGDGPLETELKELAGKLALNDLVEFLGFVESRAALPNMDILVVPSVDGEGSSGTIKEAWSVGLPLVASGLASNLELVEDSVSGLVFRPGDADDLFEKLRLVAGDPDLRARLARGGRTRVESFTAQAMARAYEELYRSLLA